MSKKKTSGRRPRHGEGEGNVGRPLSLIRSEAPSRTEPQDSAALKASVGRGTLAEKVLESIELAMEELQRVYGEVAALGKSLALARTQLVEQEEELEELRQSSLE